MPSAPAAETVVQLRNKSGAGFLDCKKALEETGGDMDKAIELLRKKGLAGAAQKAGRITKDGSVVSYIHHGGKVGVLVEINCETDFVAKTDDFQNLTRDIAMQIAAANPKWVKPEDVPADVVAREQEIYKQQAANSGKPAAALEKIIQGKLSKFYSDFCLTDQIFVKDSSGSTKVKDAVNQVISKVGENITIRRFARYQVGEEVS